MDSFNTRGYEFPLGDFVHAHVKALLTHPFLSGVPIIFVPECNLEGAAVNMVEHLPKSDLIITPTINKPGMYGLLTTNNVKAESGDMLVEVMQFKNLYFMEGFVCACPFDNRPVDVRRDAVIKTFIKQLGCTRKLFFDPLNPLQATKYTYSGKCGPDNKIIPNQNDDTVVTTSENMLIFKQLYDRRLVINSSLIRIV